MPLFNTRLKGEFEMFQFDFSIDGLYRITVKSDAEREYVQHWSVENFQRAIAHLNQAGLTQDQIQMLQRKTFSRFMDRDYQEVLLLALAIQKLTTTVARIHKYLQEREYWARINGNTILIQTERLPGIEAINAYLGLRSSSVDESTKVDN